jgi:hypothetical protein
LTDWILQTNSTVTTTVLQQQATVASFLGLPIADWITLISSVVTTVATVVLAIYAVVTVREGNKARRIASIERQLDRFYNPMYEIMTEAVEQQNEQQRSGRIVSVGEDNAKKLNETFLHYGHHLGRPTDQHKIRHLLHFPQGKGYDYVYPDDEFKDCLNIITVVRARLWIKYQELTNRFKDISKERNA